MSLDFKDIKTVNDLLNAQKSTSVTKDFVSQILNEDPSVGLEVCIGILYALLDFHASATEQYISEGRAADVSNWACDTKKLDIALDLIKDIAL